MQPNAKGLLLDFMRSIVDNEGFFVLNKAQHRSFQSYRSVLLGHLWQLYNVLKQQDQDDVFLLFEKMIIWSDKFDLGLIKYLRVSLGNFLLCNSGVSVNGLPIQFVFDTKKFNSVADYVYQVVLKMDTEAQDLILYFMPVFLRMPIQTTLMSPLAGNGLNVTYYSAILDQKKHMSQGDQLNFHQQPPIQILLKPGHYDGLCSKQTAQKISQCLRLTRLSHYKISESIGGPIKPQQSKQQDDIETANKEQWIIGLKCGCCFPNAKLLQSFQQNGFKPEQGISGLVRKQVGNLLLPRCPDCQTFIDFKDLNNFQKYNKFPRISKQLFKSALNSYLSNKPEEFSFQLRCGHKFDFLHLLYIILEKFPGKRPQAFFTLVKQSISVGHQLMQGPIPECPQCHHKIQMPDLMKICYDQFSQEQFRFYRDKWFEFPKQECRICNQVKSNDSMFLTYDGKLFYHQECAMNSTSITLSQCGHQIERISAYYSLKESFAANSQIYRFQNSLVPVFPECSVVGCRAMITVQDILTIFLNDPQIAQKQAKLKLQMQRIQNQYPRCFLCQQKFQNNTGKVITIQKEGQAHQKCIFEKIKLNCSDVHNKQNLRQFIERKFKWKPGMAYQRLFVPDCKSASFSTPYCPTCQKHLLTQQELIAVFEQFYPQIYQEERNRAIEYFNFKICFVCKEIIGYMAYVKRGGKIFHKECETKMVILGCGDYFNKQDFIRRLRIKENQPLRASYFIKNNGTTEIQMRRCPKCQKPMKYSEIKDTFSYDFQFSEQQDRVLSY